MPVVYIPTLLRELTGNRDSVEVEGATVRQVIDNLERLFPGLREKLIEGGRLRSNLSVAVNGRISRLGLREPVSPSGEVHFVAAIGGGMGQVALTSSASGAILSLLKDSAETLSRTRRV